METWKNDNTASLQPTEPTWVKIWPTKWTVAIVNALYSLLDPAFSRFACACLVKQGKEFQVSPDQWPVFVKIMDQFGLDWSRCYTEEAALEPFQISVATVYCLRNPPGPDVTQRVLALLRAYADLDLPETARDIIVKAAVEQGRPFTVADCNCEDFETELRILLPEINCTTQWAVLFGPAMA
jgi:hypothetical protein